MAVLNPDTKDLLEKRNKAVESCRKLHGEIKSAGDKATAEQHSALDAAIDDVKNCKKEYDNAIKMCEREDFIKNLDDDDDQPANRRITNPTDHTTSPNTNDSRAKTLIKWNPLDHTGSNPRVRHAERKFVKKGLFATSEYNEGFNRYVAGVPAEKAFSAVKENAAFNLMQSDDEQRGGYFITPEDFMAGILRNVDDEVFIQQNSKVIIVRNARSLGIRKRVAKVNTFAWGPELRDVTGTVDTSLKFGKRVLTPHYATGSARISRDLLRSAVENPEDILSYEVGINLREFLEQAFLTADGNEKPLGLLVASADGISTARDASSGSTVNTFTWDSFNYAKYQLKPQYRSRAKWMIHRNRLADLVALKNTQGTYLWQPSKIVGEPDLIDGLQYIESEWMPTAVGTGLYYAMLGDFSYYYIAYALDMEMQRLNEIAARTNEIEYHFRLKVDAMPILEEAFVRLKYA